MVAPESEGRPGSEYPFPSTPPCSRTGEDPYSVLVDGSQVVDADTAIVGIERVGRRDDAVALRGGREALMAIVIFLAVDWKEDL